MNEITLKDFRCFHEEQSARLAPLTLLVGANSTGKTSFLALLRALSDMAYSIRMPDFKEAPYDLGSFDEIAHHRGSRATSFVAGFCRDRGIGNRLRRFKYDVTFEKSGTVPVPVRRYRSYVDAWMEEIHAEGNRFLIEIGTANGSWKGLLPAESFEFLNAYSDRMWPPALIERLLSGDIQDDEEFVIEPLDGSPEFGPMI